jgi:phosphohistidine phosphatase
MNLYLLRHGAAGPSGAGNDRDRALTKEGRADVRAIARWMNEQGIAPTLIAASPFLRAQETAALVVKVLGSHESPETWDDLAPGGHLSTVIRRISRSGPGPLLLVGHEPSLSTLLSWITTGDENARIAMTKGSLAKIRNLGFSPRVSGELHWLVTPRLVRKER